MSWLPWKRPTSPSVPPPIPPRPEPEEPAPPRTPFAAKVEKWRAIFREQQQAQPSRDDLERAQEQARQQRVDALEDQLAQHIARWGCWFPGDTVDAERTPPRALGERWIRW